MTGDESVQEAYDRGTVAGKIDARLAGHDQHFATINGSLEKVAVELHELKLAVQRLGDQAISRDATVVTTAAALKDAEDARRSKTESAWTPIAKAIAIGSVALAAIGTVLAVLLR